MVQHLSALTRDTVGATYTNLINNHNEQKSDIYLEVARRSQESLVELITDPVIENFWKDQPITRTMAKKPVND